MAYLLTTIDNPFNPFVDYDEWYKYDVDKGYNTCAFLARVAITSDELSDVDQDQAIEQAMDEIVKYNVLGIYLKIDKDYVIKDNISIENIVLNTIST